MRKITKLLKSLLLATFLLLMTNCATEEIGQKNITQSNTEAKTWFDANKSNYDATVLKYVKDFKWEDAIISDGNDGKVIEVPFTFENNLSTTNKNADLYNDHHRLMFVKDANNGFKISYIQIFTSDKESKILDHNYNYYSIKDDFNGKVFVQELTTNTVSKLEFNNGKKIERSLTAKQREAEITCVEIGYWYEDGHFESIGVLYCEGGGPTGEPGTGGYGGGGTTPPAPTPTCPAGYEYKSGKCVLIPQIINLLTGKAKCLNELLNKNGNSFVQKLFAKFEGTSEFNITIVSKDKITDVDSQGVLKEINGATYPPVGNLINIGISTSKAETNSALDVARTILHEYIHADIFRKLGTITDGTKQERLDFKTTYEAYGNQHSTIASLYLTSMKDALKEFHKNALPDDYKKYTDYYGEVPSDAFYEALAWGGLRENNVKAWTDLSADKKAEIIALANRVPMLSKTVPSCL